MAGPGYELFTLPGSTRSSKAEAPGVTQPVRTLVWHATIQENTPTLSSLAGARKKPSIPLKMCNAPAVPDTWACDHFNHGKCFSDYDHLDVH